MTTTVLAPAQWAQTEFALAELGDRRRTERLVKMATSLAHTPTGALPQAFPDWQELKAAYRFLDHAEFGLAEIQSPHWQQTLAACRQPGEYLLIEDTTELDYSTHRQTEQLGSIGNGRGLGLWLHTTLAVRVEGWDLGQAPAGIAKVWARDRTGRIRSATW